MNPRPTRVQPDPATAVLRFVDPFDAGPAAPLVGDALAPGLHPVEFADPLADPDVVVVASAEAHEAARRTMRLEFSSLQAVYGRTEDDARHNAYRPSAKKRRRNR